MVRFHEHASLDVDDQAQALEGWEQSYEQLGCGRFSGRTRQLLMDDGVLLRESTNRPLREEIVPPRDHWVVAVPLLVEPGSMFAGRPLQATSLIPLLPGQEYDVVATGALDLLAVSAHRRVVETLEPAVQDWLNTLRGGRTVALTPTAAAASLLLLQGAMARAEALVTSRAEAGQGADEEDSLLADVLAGVLSLAAESDHAAGPSTIPRRAQARQQVARRAIDFMRANLQHDIRVPDICAAAYASRRTLQYCFEEFLHTTPQAYLRALRLNEARRVLKSRPGLPITEVAGDLGFCSASHFTQHYKEMFGELPSQTLRLC